MSNTFVYLVGDAESPKTNQWLAMCASAEAAAEFAKGVEGPVTHKTVEVKPRRPQRGKRRAKR